jgi:hypothetical protein
MSQRVSGSYSGASSFDGGPFTAIGGMALLINLVGLYSFTGVAICVFGYIALTLVLSSRALGAANSSSANAGNVAMFFSWLVALVGGVLVGAFHWVSFAHAAMAVLAAYALAIVIWLLGRALDAFWSWLFPLSGVAMLAAVMQLGAPPGADDMDKAESWTPVTVTAIDEAGQPIADATVYLDLVHFWQGDPELDGQREWWTKGSTNKDGVAQMSLQEDPRFKRLVIRVLRGPSGGWNAPATIGDCIGYQDARQQTTLPAPKVPYLFNITMPLREHPESAVVAFTLDTPSVDITQSRSIKVSLGAGSTSYADDGGRTLNEEALAAQGQLRDLYIHGPQKLAFKLGSDLADRPLTLRVLEPDWSRNDHPLMELTNVSIDPIPLGRECVLSPVRVSPRNMATAERDRSDSRY